MNLRPSQPVMPVLRPNRNALHATGPVTAQGKANSSRNAIKHGLTARQVVIPGESQDDFDNLLVSIALDRQPEGELEIQMVGEIAACIWRLSRARSREAETLETTGGLFTNGQRAADFDRIVRYMSTIERQLNRAIVRLQHLQNERRQQHPATSTAAADAKPAPKTMAAAASNHPTEPFVLLPDENATSCAPVPFVSSTRKPAATHPPATPPAAQSGS